MTNRRIRHARAELPRLPPDHYAQHIVTEAEASELWRRCMNQIDEHLYHKQKPLAGLFKVGKGHTGQLYVLVNRNGHLERFWLRLSRDNTLVIVGCRRGLFPLTVEPVHG